MTEKTKSLRLTDEELQRIEAIKDPDIKLAAWLRRAALMRLESEEGRKDMTEKSEPIKTKPVVNEHGAYTKHTTQQQREQLVKECYEKGMDYKQTANWLNENGYQAQRGEFTPNSVRSIKARMSKMGKL